MGVAASRSGFLRAFRRRFPARARIAFGWRESRRLRSHLNVRTDEILLTANFHRMIRVLFIETMNVRFAVELGGNCVDNWLVVTGRCVGHVRASQNEFEAYGIRRFVALSARSVAA